MGILKGNCLVAQSGGPTSVINASACGVIQEAFKSGEVDKVFAGLHGVAGVLNEDLFQYPPSLSVDEVLAYSLIPSAFVTPIEFILS